MLGALINLIVVLLIVGVVWWAINQLIGLLNLPEPIPRVVQVVLIVVLFIVVLYALLALVPVSGVHLRY